MSSLHLHTLMGVMDGPPAASYSGFKFSHRLRLANLQPRHLALVAGLICASLLLGSLAARPEKVPYASGMLACLLAIVVAAFLFADRVFPVFAGWVAVEAVAYPFIRYPLHHDVATFDRFVILGLGVSLLLTSWRPMTAVSRKATWAFAIFALIYGASTVITLVHPLPRAPLQPLSSPIQPGINWIQYLLLPFIVFVVAARIMSYRRWRVLAKALAFLGVSLAFLGLVINWGLGIILTTFSGPSPFLVPGVAGLARATGPYESPSAYGAVMIVCIAATLYLIQVDKVYLWGGVAFALEVFSLAPTLTKTVWAAGLVTIVVALGVRRRVTSRVLLVGLTAALILVITYSFVGKSQVFTARTTSAESVESFDGRIAAWHQGLLIFRHWPWLGAGAWQFVEAQPLVPQVYFKGVAAVASAHNTEIAVLGETGLLGELGLVVLAYMMVRLIRTWRRQAQTSEEVIFGATVLAAVTGYLVLAQTFGELYDPPSAIFCALMLGAAAGRLNHKAYMRQENSDISESTDSNQRT